MNHRVKYVFGLALVLTLGGAAFVSAQEAAPATTQEAAPATTQEAAPATTQEAAPATTPAASIVPQDQQPTDAQLNRLFEVMRVNQQMASMRQMMPQLIQKEIDGHIKQMEQEHPEMTKMTPEQRKAFSAAMGKFMQKAMTIYTGDDMVADMKNIYKKHLAQSDVENIITFFNSTSGQRVLDMAPVMMQEYLPLIMHKTEAGMKPLLTELQLQMAQIMATPASTGTTPKQ